MRKTKLFIHVLILIASVYGISIYLDTSKVYSLDDTLSFISNCGNFIQSSFRNVQRDQMDYFIVILSVLIVACTLFFSLRYLIKPGEKTKNHIKYKILEEHKK